MASPPTPAAGCDCSVCPFYTGNPEAVEPICSGCNTDCSWCGCARAGGGSKCGQCPIRCGSRTDIEAWMDDVGGTLAFDDIAIDVALPSGQPRFVPQVDTAKTASLDGGMGWPAYAIGLRRVLSPRTYEITPTFSGGTAVEALGLSEDQRAVLVGYGTDPLVEAFWTRRHQLYPKLAAQQWDLVLAPNYSVYGNYPRAEMLLNLRRNLLVAAEMAAAGIPAVPNLYWFRLEDIRRLVRWLAETRPLAVAVNCQTFRAARDWRQMALPGLALLADGMPASTDLVVVGTSRAGRIGQLAGLFGDRLHLIAQNPTVYARHGAVMTAGGRRDYHARTSDAFAANVRYYAGLLDEHASQP